MNTSVFETNPNTYNVFESEKQSEIKEIDFISDKKEDYSVTYLNNNDLSGEHILYTLKKKTDSILKVILILVRKKDKRSLSKKFDSFGIVPRRRFQIFIFRRNSEIDFKFARITFID